METHKKTKFENAVSDKIRQLRIERNLSQDYIANVLGLSRGFIGQVESPNSPTKYSLDQLNRLAKEFECSPKDFMPDSWIEEDGWIEEN